MPGNCCCHKIKVFFYSLQVKRILTIDIYIQLGQMKGG